MSFYADMAQAARELLAPKDEGGLGQGSIVLVRYGDAPAGQNPWDAPLPPSREKTPLNGIARGVAKELVGSPVENGGQIVATDLQAIVAPWGGEYAPGDVLEIDGSSVTVLRVENIPAAGPVCAVRFVVRR